MKGNVKQGCDRAAPASQRVLAGGHGGQAGRGCDQQHPEKGK